ncbi:MAG TPA: hypothetical protein VF483_01680 [Gemmatimonadaceae bacterium]
MQPATGAGPEPGTLMAFEVNDVGRLALGGQMGPEIAHIEGRLLSNEKDEYQVAVRSVKLIRGGDQIWSGERVSIKKEYVSETYERRFSKSRTIALAAVFVVSVYAIVRAENLFGIGKEGDPADRHDTAITFVPRSP